MGVKSVISEFFKAFLGASAEAGKPDVLSGALYLGRRKDKVPLYLMDGDIKTIGKGGQPEHAELVPPKSAGPKPG